MTQYKTTTKEDLGGGICKITFEDKHSDTAWGRSVADSVNAALVEQGHFEKDESIAACWTLTVWYDSGER